MDHTMALLSPERATADQQAAKPPAVTNPTSVFADDFSDRDFTHHPCWGVQSGQPREDTVETVRFNFSTQLAALEKLFENQPAPVLLDEGKAFQDRFESFEVHIYRLRR